LLAFHGHFNEAAAFGPLAKALAPGWRVIALDQRGHGESHHALSYGRDDYISDIAAFHRHLGLGPVAVAGHSLGGVNAYQYAARHPGLVTALVVEDIGAVVNCDLAFVEGLPRSAPTRPALMTAIGAAAPYLECSVRQSAHGWAYSFDLEDTACSEMALSGDHWDDWTKVKCPTLLIRGRRSDLLTAEHARDMGRPPGWPGRTGRV
jgi:pimeloyl-ACP methyl ester carboxylesterase